MWDEIEGDVVWTATLCVDAVWRLLWGHASPKSTNNQVVQAFLPVRSVQGSLSGASRRLAGRLDLLGDRQADRCRCTTG